MGLLETEWGGLAGLSFWVYFVEGVRMRGGAKMNEAGKEERAAYAIFTILFQPIEVLAVIG